MLTDAPARVDYRLGRTFGVPGGVCVVVTRAVAGPGELRCHGRLLVAERPPRCSANAPRGEGRVRAGDVLWDPVTGFEIRCTRAGAGALDYSGRPMVRRPAGGRGAISADS